MDTPPPSPTIADDIPCPNIRKMVRIVGGSQPYEVVYALNATEMMLVENIAKVMDNFARIFQFEVVPTVDSGGTLRLRAEFNNTFEVRHLGPELLNVCYWIDNTLKMRQNGLHFANVL